MKTKHSSVLRWPQRLTRATAWVALLSFGFNLATPTLVLARDAVPATPAGDGPAAPRFDELSETLIRLEEALDRMHRRLQGEWEFEWQAALNAGQAKPAAAERAALRALEDELEAAVPRLESLQGALRAAFVQTRREFAERALPAEILARHDETVDAYDARYATLRSHLHAIKTARTLDEFRAAVAAAHGFMQANSSRPAHKPFEAGAPLAFGPGQRRAPGEPGTAEAMRAALGLAAGKRAGADAKSAPTAADLAETVDVQLSAAIRAKAQELGNDPVAIYRFVRNEVEFLPTFGSIQGAEQTLRTLRGNAFDQSSLLIALLRAADIPARYVYGTIELPIDQARNWVGGATNADAALDILSGGGIPNVGVTSNGTWTKVRLEHAWVEAFVDFVPSRGAKHQVGDTWVPLDPSVKTHRFPEATMPDGLFTQTQGLLGGLIESGESLAGGKAYTGFDAAPVQAALQDFAPQAFQQLRALPEGTDIFDLLGQATIEPSEATIFAPVLPHRVMSVAARFPVLPDALRQQVQLELQALPQYGGEPTTLFAWSGALPALEMKSLDLRFDPATAADAATWDSYNASGATQMPLYAVRARAVLAVDGTTVASGPSQQLGAPLRLLASIGLPGRTGDGSFVMTAGDRAQIGIDSAGYTQGTAYQLIERPRTDSVEENLYLTARTHWLEEDIFGQLLAAAQKTQFVRMPSVGVFARPLTVTYRFGLPHMGYYDSSRTDIQMSRMHVSALDGSPKKAGDFVRGLGVVGSTLEGGVIEQLFRRSYGRGSNTARILELANEQNVPTYVLGPGDGALLSQLSHSSDVLADVGHALASGREVVIPQREIVNGTWRGAGYIVRDPVTGAGAYLIDGGYAGNSVTECERATVPVPVEAPAMSRIALLLLATSPLVLDDEEGEVNGVAVAALALFAIVVVTAAVMLAPVEAAGAALATGARFVFSRIAVGLGLTLGVAGTAAAADDDCSCAMVPTGFHLGGHVIHNLCADYVTDPPFRGSDIFMSGKNFDAANVLENRVWEIKTNRFPYYKDGQLNITLNAVVITKHLFEFQEDKEIATSCNVDFLFGVRTPAHMAAMQLGLLASGDDEDVVLHGCPIP